MANKTSNSWNLSFSVREAAGEGEMRSASMSWENQPVEQVIENLNAFLVLTGSPVKVVPTDPPGR